MSSSFSERKPLYIYADQLLCLLALTGMAVWRSGARALGLTIAAVLAGVIVDMICCRMTRKVYNPRDLSTICTGLCLAMMSPVTLHYGLIIFGAALALGVKHIFGGKDNYIFNPAAVAFAFLIICYPGRMLLFPPIDIIPPLFGESALILVHGLESSLLHIGAIPSLTPIDLLIGSFAGPMGTTHVLIIIVCAVCLMCRRSVSPVVTISCLSIIAISRLLFPVHDDIINALVYELVGGYLLFGLLFLANDPQTLPKTAFGRLYYGILLGIFTIAFRAGSEGWFIFALLASNTLASRMDVAAESTRDRVNLFRENLKKRLSAYERFREDAKAGVTPALDLTVTQEIVLSPSDYDMPPINNKVIKVKRKKRNVLTVVIEKLGSLKKNPEERHGGEVIPHDSYTDERRPNFVFAAFAALFDSFKRQPKKPPPPLEIITTVENYEDLAPDVSDISISDFEEIADDITKIEDKILEFSEFPENPGKEEML